MMQKIGSYKLSIFGDQYSIKSDEPLEQLMQAASLVDTTMKEIAHGSQLDVKSIAVLAALRIAHQLNCNAMQSGQSQTVITLIDRELEQLGFLLE